MLFIDVTSHTFNCHFALIAFSNTYLTLKFCDINLQFVIILIIVISQMTFGTIVLMDKWCKALSVLYSSTRSGIQFAIIFYVNDPSRHVLPKSSSPKTYGISVILLKFEMNYGSQVKTENVERDCAFSVKMEILWLFYCRILIRLLIRKVFFRIETIRIYR
jgi:hypothetical protein